jgi:hypothetical protein
MRLLLVGLLAIAFVACQKGGDGAGETENIPKSSVTGSWRTYGYKWGSTEYKWSEMRHTSNGKESKHIPTEYIFTDNEISEVNSDSEGKVFSFHTYSYSMRGRDIITGNSSWGSKQPDMFLHDIRPDKLYLKLTYPNSKNSGEGLLILSRISEQESHKARATSSNFTVPAPQPPKEPMEQKVSVSYTGKKEKGPDVKGAFSHSETSKEGSKDLITCSSMNSNNILTVNYAVTDGPDTTKSYISLRLPKMEIQSAQDLTTTEVAYAGKEEDLTVLIFDGDKYMVSNSKDDTTCTAKVSRNKNAVEGKVTCDKVNVTDRKTYSINKKESSKVEVNFACRLTAY